MKQKYVIFKSDDKKYLIIREIGVLDKDILSLLCEEKYDSDEIESAISGGKESLIFVLRNNNMFPPQVYANKIADAVIDIYGHNGDKTAEIEIDDAELMAKEVQQPETMEDTNHDSSDIDNLLDDNSNNILSDGNLKVTQESTTASSAVKVADGEPSDDEDKI